MAIEYEHRGLLGRKQRRVVEEEEAPERNGIFYDHNTAGVDENTLEQLYDHAEGLEYGSSLASRMVQRHFGGRLKTPYGTRDWMGSMPDDVREFVEEVEDAIGQRGDAKL